MDIKMNIAEIKSAFLALFELVTVHQLLLNSATGQEFFFHL